jgi:hypothetical protein
MGRALAALLACAAVPLGVVALNPPGASADIGGGLPGITENGSDPMVTRCRFNNQNGFCMVTSQDVGTGATTANPYPMNRTKGYFSTDGQTWQDQGQVVGSTRAVFTESQITTNQPGGFVPPGTNHLWAPDLVRAPDGSWRIYEPDVSDNSEAGSHVSSRIAMASSSSPFGPFTVQGTVSFSEGGAVQYGSDPEVLTDNGAQTLFWVNGDGPSCGEYMYSPLNSDGLTVSGRNTYALAINGLPSFLGSCHRANTAFPYAADYPYMEGASVFKTADLAPDLTGLPGPYILLMPVATAGQPPECQLFGGGKNSVLAYATADNATGPYTYRGILMCGSTSEWTNQAYLAEVTARNGAKRIALYYHDGTWVNGSPNRKIHAECLWYGGGTFAMATRTTTGFSDCMAGTDSNTWVLRRPGQLAGQFREIITTEVDSGGVLTASRAAVGAWEKFQVFRSDHSPVAPNASGTITVNLVSQANQKFVCADNSGNNPLIANRTTAGAWEQFKLVTNGTTATLTATINNKGVATQSNQRLIANATTGDSYVIMHL